VRYRSGRSPDWLKMKNPAAPSGKAGGWGRLGAMTRKLGYARLSGVGLLGFVALSG
jgi:hypothetical protein